LSLSTPIHTLNYLTSPRSTLIKEAGTIIIDEDAPTYYQKISNEANGIFKDKSESLIHLY